MLACFVCAGPRGKTIVAELVEAGAADDRLVTGLAFGALVDNPATASDIADAFIGEILAEAANATATQNAGLSYGLLVDEPAIAADAVSGTTGIVIGAVVEATVADAVQSATVISGLVPRHAMLAGVFVNSSGTPRAANVDGIMVNL